MNRFKTWLKTLVPEDPWATRFKEATARRIEWHRANPISQHLTTGHSYHPRLFAEEDELFRLHADRHAFTVDHVHGVAASGGPDLDVWRAKHIG